MAVGPASVPPAVLGILYAEDFDEPQPSPTSQPEGEAEPDPVFTQADIDQASVTAVEAARRRWEKEAEERRTTALGTIALALRDARQAAEQTTLAATESLAATMLAMLTGLLPHFTREHGPAEVQALIGRLLPTLRAEPQITIRAHHELVATLERDVAQLDADLAGTVHVVAAPLQPGDVKVTWQSGSLTRDTQKIMQAMTDALGQLGLHAPSDPASPTAATPKRKLAYAE